MEEAVARPRARVGRRLHPWPIRVMHWTNAVAMLVMITSGWGIYDDDVVIKGLHFPKTCGWATGRRRACNWHFAGMWLLALNGLSYLVYGCVTGRLRERLLPIRLRDVIHTVARHAALQDRARGPHHLQRRAEDPLHRRDPGRHLAGRDRHGDLEAGAVLRPGRLLGGFQVARIIHFTGMAVIVGFLVVHVALALLVPQTLWAMLTGGPRVASAGAGRPRAPHAHEVALPAHAAARPGDPRRPPAADPHAGRRGLLRGGLSLGALTMLTGCDVKRRPRCEAALLAISRAERRRAGLAVRPDQLAPTYPASHGAEAAQVQRLLRRDEVKPVDGADLAPGAGRAGRRQAALDGAADRRPAAARR